MGVWHSKMRCAPRLLTRLFWLAIAVIGASCAGLATGPDRAEPERSPAAAWRVACDFDNAPFAYLDAAGRPVGRDVVMTELLALRLGLALEWVHMPFEKLLPAVERAEVDAVVATVGITAERAERVRFSRPYFETTIAVVVRRGPGEPRTVADLASATVLAAAGTTAERAVIERLGAGVLFAGDKDQRASVDLLLGLAADAIAMDEPNAVALVRSRPTELDLLRGSLARERYAVVVPKSRWRQLAHIDEALLALEAEGELARLDAAYGVAEAVRR